MDYHWKTSSEAVKNTGIFAEYDTAIDPIDNGGLSMPLLEGHHGRRHDLVTAM